MFGGLFTDTPTTRVRSSGHEVLGDDVDSAES